MSQRTMIKDKSNSIYI